MLNFNNNSPKEVSEVEKLLEQELDSQTGDGTSFLNRNTSSFPISIGTSLALESIFMPRTKPYDLTRSIPNEIHLSDYDEIWFNTSTLFRNLKGSVTGSVIKNTNHKEMIDYLVVDMANIMDLFLREGKGMCKVNFYTASYKSIKSKYSSSKVVKFREKITAIQKHDQDLEDSTIKELLKRYPNDIVKFDSKIKPTGISTNALIMTHIPYDLCSYGLFSKLHLLESHTGVLKTRRDWASKFNIYETERHLWLPFLEKLLLIFGDPYLIKPMLPGIRAEVIRIGRSNKWTPMTTLDKVNMDLTDITEDMVRHIIVSL